jgi:hypothetical protein
MLAGRRTCCRARPTHVTHHRAYDYDSAAIALLEHRLGAELAGVVSCELSGLDEVSEASIQVRVNKGVGVLHLLPSAAPARVPHAAHGRNDDAQRAELRSRRSESGRKLRPISAVGCEGQRGGTCRGGDVITCTAETALV